MSTLGTKIAIGDTDAIIALFNKSDANHNRARDTDQNLLSENFSVIFPNTAIIEAMTVFQRKIKAPELTELLHKNYQTNKINVLYVDHELMISAGKLFDPKGAKQNTLFDAIVAATAKSLATDTIFSFDKWYQKQGFELAG